MGSQSTWSISRKAVILLTCDHLNQLGSYVDFKSRLQEEESEEIQIQTWGKEETANSKSRSQSSKQAKFKFIEREVQTTSSVYKQKKLKSEKPPDKSSTNSYQKTDAWFVHWQSSLGFRTQFEVDQEVDQKVVRIILIVFIKQSLILGCSCNNHQFEVLLHLYLKLKTISK